MAKKTEQLEFHDGRSIMTPDGSEIPDPRPVQLPVGFERPESIQDLIRRLVTDRQIRDDLASSDIESFDEADDFDVMDDIPPTSPYEENFDPQGIIAKEQAIRAGAVRDLTPEEKEAAIVLANKAKAVIAARKKPQEPPTTDSPKA